MNEQHLWKILFSVLAVLVIITAINFGISRSVAPSPVATQVSGTIPQPVAAQSVPRRSAPQPETAEPERPAAKDLTDEADLPAKTTSRVKADVILVQ